jgi:energy-coupling factor transport system ATP-binding protein
VNPLDQEAPPAGASPSQRPEVAHGPLQALELATAAVLGAMTVVFVIAGWFLPHGTAVATLGTVPMGVIAYRHRLRAVVAGVVAAASVGFLVAGTGVISTVVLCGAIGGLAGLAHRRQWSFLRLAAAASLLGPTIAAIVIGLMVGLSSLRKLTLEQLRNTWRGLSGLLGRLLGSIPGLHQFGPEVTRQLDRVVTTAIRDWWETVAVIVIVFTVSAELVAHYLLGIVFVRLDRICATDRLATTRPALEGEAVGPVPVELRGVGVRYPGAAEDALTDVALRIEVGEMVAVLGPNGSGKSTLSRVLAGCPPTAGEVSRAGAVGLGAPGGTAIVAQRPESQVLGVRVADDVVWGLPRQFEVDVPALLADVGLEGMERHETSGLSGGQLQRLAVAAALARRPRLLISDESTAMIDDDGRRRLVALLSDLPQRRAMTVVHVTHRLIETADAHRVVHLAAGRVVTPGEAAAAAPLYPERRPAPSAPAAGPAPVAPSRPLRSDALRLRLHHVGHVYADGTPWARRALSDVDLEIRAGEGLLVVGGNGSGKSTLAWILAGLTRPTFGDCELDGRPVREQIGAVGLAFQHARLQVQRSTVGRDVRAAGDVDRDAAEAALRLVGLDPAPLWERSVDELSGGQLRRVALAGLLTRVPAVLVLDEPLAGLDEASRAGLLAVLSDLRTCHGLTLVVISHDLEGAGEICDRVVRLDAGRVTSDEALLPAPVAAG